MQQFRIGNGYDLHKLVENRDLILGGIKIDYEKGLLGHSDADVLIHAIMDAMLGALALGDIGKHFPPDDMQYKDISSLKLLHHVNLLIKEQGYVINNIDTVIQAQKPKLLPFVAQMQEKIAKDLSLEPDQVSIKATTMEGIGPIGEGAAIAAHAVVLLENVY